MLYVDIDMPKGALLPDQGVAQDPRGIVFDAATLVLEDTRVTGWRDLSGTYIARPATPNDGHSKIRTPRRARCFATSATK